MVIVLLKNRIYNHGDVDNILHGLKHSKNAAQLASPQEHEIYKHQYEMLENYINQNTLNRARSLEQFNEGEEGDDLTLLSYSNTCNETDRSKTNQGVTPVCQTKFHKLFQCLVL